MSMMQERMKVGYRSVCRNVNEGISRFLREERGDLISSLGWMAIMALLLVVVKGLIDGKLVTYVGAIFTQLDKVFN